MKRKLIAVTVDLDWACDEVIAPTLALLEKYGLAATIFCTHIPALDTGGHELAPHPSYDGEADMVGALRKAAALTPGALGVRSHCLVSSSRLYPEYERLGLRYESNYMLYRTVVAPFRMMNGIRQFPIYFMDDIHLAMGGGGRFDIGALLPETDWEIITFDFHPIHIFLNTADLATYARAKEHYQNPIRLRDFVNPGRGTATLFEDLLKLIAAREDLQAITLRGWLEKHATEAGR